MKVNHFYKCASLLYKCQIFFKDIGIQTLFFTNMYAFFNDPMYYQPIYEVCSKIFCPISNLDVSTSRCNSLWFSR